MPEFTVKEVRVPELHLPEIKRDDIVRTLSGARLPEIDLAKARRASVKIPTVTISGSDVGRLLTAGAAIARLARPGSGRRPWQRRLFARRGPSPIERIVQPKRRRSRRPLLIAVIAVFAVGAWAILRRPDVRRRIGLAVEDARTRMAQRWAGDDMALTEREPVAVMASPATTTVETVDPSTAAMDDVTATAGDMTSHTSDAAATAIDPPQVGDTPDLEERTPAG